MTDGADDRSVPDGADDQWMADAAGRWMLDRHGLVVGAVVLTLVLTGPVVGLDVTRPPPELDDGTADVALVDELPSTLAVTDGRFGTSAKYVRVPPAVVDVRALEGTPRLVYSITVPELDIDRTERRLLTTEGRVRLTPADRAVSPEVAPGTYEGRLTLRLQSFSGGNVLTNRSVEVTVP